MTDRARSQWIDISVPLKTGMVHWPGDAPVDISRIRDINQGDTVNLSVMAMGAHSGTHMDAPLHFIPGGAGIGEMPLDNVVGRARVIEIRDTESVKPAELQGHRIRRGERLLFKTRNSAHAWRRKRFVEDFVFISDDAACFLTERGVKVVGIDYLSVGSYKHGGSYVHKTLLGGGIWIIEGLDLSRVIPGKYELICLPLRLIQGDGAPARAIVRPVPPGRAFTA